MELLNKTIIFDFDGTIADTLETVAVLYNQIAPDFNCKPLSFNDKEKFRSMKAGDFLKECKIPALIIPVLAIRIKAELRHKIEDIRPIKGITEILFQLKNNGYKIGVMSSNTLANINAFLRYHKMENIFDFVHSGKNIFGKDKVILRLLSKYKIKRNQVIYVGDETRDIEALKRIRVPIIAVSWGFNSHSVLEKQKPDALIDIPDELLGVINKLFNFAY